MLDMLIYEEEQQLARRAAAPLTYTFNCTRQEGYGRFTPHLTELAADQQKSNSAAARRQFLHWILTIACGIR